MNEKITMEEMKVKNSEKEVICKQDSFSKKLRLM